MTRLLLLVVCGLTACGYSHIASTRATFRQAGTRLLLQVDRHHDTVVSGPDIEEDQRLVLELTGYKIGQRIPVPSPQVLARFTVERFGPSATAQEITGYVVVKEVGEQTAIVGLHLNITAHTSTGSYRQNVKYRGDHTFVVRGVRAD